MLRNLWLRCGFFVLCVVFLSSCKTTPTKTASGAVPGTVPSIGVSNPNVSMYPMPGTMNMTRGDISHIVAPGETLWRISKMYDVSLKDIMDRNNLSSPRDLKMGQKLLIPNAASIKAVIPLYPSTKWKYIIVHHSATDEGDALAFNGSHKKRGFWHGLGYHFVIDNGTTTKADGQIEISPRWIKQQDGAHCKAGGMNKNGIGVCLVGNFSKDYVSEKQMRSLIYLVNLLRKYYNIPISNIKGHGKVSGASTECPGKKFPWSTFYSRLQQEA